MDLIGALVSNLGVNQQAAQGAAGSVFKLIKQHAAPADFAAVEQGAPEVGGWMQTAPEPSAGGGGLGGLLGAAAGALGGGGAGGLGGAGALAGLGGALGKLGLDGGAMGKIVPLVAQFLQARVGGALVGRLLGAVPGLGQLAGGGQGGSPLGGILGNLMK